MMHWENEAKMCLSFKLKRKKKRMASSKQKEPTNKAVEPPPGPVKKKGDARGVEV